MRRIDVIFRPLEQPWENPLGDDYRDNPRFATRYSDIIELLSREVEHLGAREVVVQVDATENQIRNDGLLRSDATIRFPGVRVNIDSRHGPLTYATDRFGGRYTRFSGNRSTTYVPGWHSNLYAIALSLEALRKVDRYGVAGSGEQYRGWNALPPGTPMGPATMTFEDACRVLHIIVAIDPVITKERVANAYKTLAKEHHPDAGGDPVEFQRIKEARDLLMKEL